MRDEWRELMKKEMIEDAARIMEEVNADPSLKDVKAPEKLHDKLFAQIREYEEQRMHEQLSDEDKELIQLGKIYKRKRKWTKYLVLVAAVLAVLALGTVCIGEDENVFIAISRMILGEERVVINSEETETVKYIEEDKAYAEIEKKYRFTPVELEHLPEGTVFSEAAFSEDMQSVNMIYEMDNGNSIVYVIRPNYREASLGTIIEDEKIQEYKVCVRNVEVDLVEYNIEGTEENRWSASFIYQDVQYLLWINNMEQQEVEQIVNNLEF